MSEQKTLSAEEAEIELNLESFQKVLRIAQTDTSGGRCCGKFFLAWEDKEKFGGWDVSDLWVLDCDLKDHLIRTIKVMSLANGQYPSQLAPNAFKNIVRIWGPRRK